MSLPHYILAILLLAITVCTASRVVELNDASFEHTTQASTGATTGSWLVEFYAPWCAHCQQLSPTWHKLADTLHDMQAPVSVAAVDGTTSPQLLQRFDVKHYPTVFYFHHGKQYSVDDVSKQSVDQLVDFVMTGYKDAASTSVMSELSAFGGVKAAMLDLVNDIKQLFFTKPIAVSLIFNTGLFAGITISNIIKAVLQPAKPAAPQVRQNRQTPKKQRQA